jgi:hypothetical protein
VKIIFCLNSLIFLLKTNKSDSIAIVIISNVNFVNLTIKFEDIA